MTAPRPLQMDAPVTELRLQPPRRVRRPKLAVASVLLVALCGAVFTSLYLRAGHLVPVLAVVRPLARGQRVTASDLTVVRVAAARGLRLVPQTDESTVAGQRAAVALEPGSLLTPLDVTSASPLAPGMAMVGVSLKPGQLPGQGVAPGARVEVIATPAAGGSGTTPGSSGVPTALTGSVRVVGVQQPPAGSGSNVVVVSLDVPSVLAPAVVAASAAGQAALVVVAPAP